MFCIFLRTILFVITIINGRWSSSSRATNVDPVELTKKLINYRTIFPDDKGSLDFLQNLLEPYGFRCNITRTGEKTYPVRNLYARYYGNNGVGGITNRPHLCFVGHVDIVPPGDPSKWTYPPYAAEIHDGILYGRGAVDMKSAIAAFVSAVCKLLNNNNNNNNNSDSSSSSSRSPFGNGSVSFILTSNEEGPKNEYGTDSVLKLLENRGEKIDFTLIGEPTSEKRFGDMIKIGRRGSITFRLKLYGKQGHVAYHELADNPVHRMVDILSRIKSTVLDNGTEYFQPSNCEIVDVHVGNTANNVIPGSIESRFNIRYNTLHSAESLTAMVKRICDRVTDKYEMSIAAVGGGAFIEPVNKPTRLLMDIIEKQLGIKPTLSTSGGTSDARFVRNYCNLVEFGLLSRTAHHYDEHANVDDIYKLTDIYERFITGYFATHR